MTGVLLEETETGSKKRITVTLDSGRSVFLSGAPEDRKGSRVVVQEFTTRILGQRSYRFVSFDETK